jgi:hypothetical protein
MIAPAPRDTRLRGRLLTFVRLVWIVIALFYLGSFAASLPTTLSQHKGFAQQSQGWTEADMRSSLAQLGLSLEAYQKYDTWSNLAITFVFFGLGLFIFWRRSDDWAALLFSALFLTFPGTVIFGTLAQVHPAWTTVRAVTDSLTSINFISLLIFPDGRFVPRWTRWVALGYIGVQVWRLFQPDLYQQFALMFAIPVFTCTIVSQVYRYQRVSTPTQRQQTKWVVFGLAAGWTPLLCYLLIDLSNPKFTKPGALGMAMFLLGNLLWSVSLVSLTVSVTLAILRSRLWDIDVIIRRTLVYGALTAILALVYFGGVAILQALFSKISNQQSTIINVLSTLAIAALFTPLRRRIQHDIDRRFYRKKYDAQKTLESFAARARDEVELEQLTAHLVTVVQDTMQPESVSLWLRKPHR